MKSILGKAISTLATLAFAGGVQAAPMVLAGDHFSVTFDDAQVGLYKPGKLSGSLDTVYFQPSAFSVFSVGGNPSKSASLQLSFTVDPGYVFTGVSFTERGDYFLSKGGAMNATAKLTATNAATLDTVVLDLAPGSPLAQVGGSTLWELAGALPASSIGLPQTFTLNLDSTLFGQPSAGGMGFMQTTYVGFTIGTAAVPAAVPEPGNAVLFACGITAMLIAVRFRRGRAEQTENA